MPQSAIHELTLAPETAYDPEALRLFLAERLHRPAEGLPFRLLRRSVDARGRQVRVQVAVEVFERALPPAALDYRKEYPDVRHAAPVVVVGAGPAGMFAALRLVELGFKPIVLDRGKDVRARRRDLAAISKHHEVDPDSNYCFGEGGAGTYSDGKLYTRSKKRGSWKRILEIFVAHGANPDILVEAHPHIGTNKLPGIVQAIRESIVGAGGEFHFGTRMVRLLVENGRAKGVLTQHGDKVEGEAVLLATGHSARDVFELLHGQGIAIEAKPFALGLRVEHAQPLIDRIQYHCGDRGLLPPASYSLVSQVPYQGLAKGVFSFCMCPGGFIVPAATAPGEVVVNGMSPSRRNSKYANSGIVAAVDASDWAAFAQEGPLAGLRYQQAVERLACQLAGGRQTAPAQLLADFASKRPSKSLLGTSYQPGLEPVELGEVLPAPVAYRLRQGFRDFGKKMKGFLTNEAQVVGVESRTSSPVRIPRDADTLEHPQVPGLYPCGEGAGYAGGIASAAMDGERCAEQIALRIGKRPGGR
jgi:hypothetical protein